LPAIVATAKELRPYCAAICTENYQHETEALIRYCV